MEVIDGLLRDQHLTYHGAYCDLDKAPLAPAPVQRPRPPLMIAANGKRALGVVAAHADVWVSLGGEGASIEEELESLRERNRLLDEHCKAIGREPETVERAYFVWGAAEAPFVSAAAFQDFVGRYREVGVQRLIFAFASATAPSAAVAAGRLASREVLVGHTAISWRSRECDQAPSISDLTH